MGKFEVSGLDELGDFFGSMADKADELISEEPTVGDVMTSQFLKKHAGVASVDEFVRVGGFVQELEDIPDDEFDAYVGRSTKFDSWNEMINAAANEYLAERLGL